jgi:hypothetical protein
MYRSAPHGRQQAHPADLQEALYPATADRPVLLLHAQQLEHLQKLLVVGCMQVGFCGSLKTLPPGSSGTRPGFTSHAAKPQHGITPAQQSAEVCLGGKVACRVGMWGMRDRAFSRAARQQPSHMHYTHQQVTFARATLVETSWRHAELVLCLTSGVTVFFFLLFLFFFFFYPYGVFRQILNHVTVTVTVTWSTC